MLQRCPQCQHTEVSDRTANRYFAACAVLAVVGTLMIFISWPWSLLIITAMLVCVVGAVAHPRPEYKCKNCGHEWKSGGSEGLAHS